ncbi:ATP-binding protein [Psychromonas sp. B3M02]|uniref:ATP-binding protein n=1 Tax=Psychromonas sp. B3M02 TaxID=2267226 RepID=UPI000DE97166|nr:ATP-binding protein [Psychromonas sp. B3M02]RBW46118.1 ATP-binding protein [Psychromonas sp. B3M02]
MITIQFPKQFGRDTLEFFFKDLEKNLNAVSVCVDCSTLEFSYPSGMLIAGSKIRKWIEYRRENGLVTDIKGHDSNKKAHGYLGHLGFFDFIGFEEGKTVGEAKGSITYLPITLIQKPIIDFKDHSLQDWYDDIMSKTRRLANLLSGTNEYTEENRLYHYALREIVRNVFEHSGSNECHICGQRWANGRVEVAVVDNGIGIAKSLQRSYAIESQSQALRMSIKPGVSSTRKIPENENIYDNSGFGLYVLNELASSFGWFLLGSGDAKLVSQGQRINVTKLSFRGTYIGLKLNKAPSQFSGLCKDIILSGEDESGVKVKASGMSKYY